MALFGGRKKKASADGDSVEVVPAAPAAAAPKAKKHKPNEMLSSVIKESTEGAAVALMRANEPFLLEGGTKAAILLLDVSRPSFGGLSQKQRGDEDKGSIIELIQADHIKTVATAGMLAEDVFGIIPTHDTVERMDEFDLLVETPYTWGVVTLSPFGVAEGAETTFSVAKQVANSLLDIGQAIGADAAATQVIPAAVASTPAAVPAPADDEVDFGEEFDEDSIPELDDLPADDVPVAGHAGSEDDLADLDDDAVDYGDLDQDDTHFDDGDGEFPFDADDSDLDYGSDDQDAFLADDDETPQDEEIDYDREVSDDEVQDTIARRYLSGDLGLEVDLEPFERYLGTQSPIALFSEDADVDDWLGNQIAQMAKQANAELLSFNQRSLGDLRQQYLGLMSMHVEQVNDQLDVENPSTVYGELTAAAADDHRSRMTKYDEIIAGRKREIVQRFDDEAEDRAKAAAAMARSQYKDRNGSRMERELSEITSQVAAQNDDVLAQQREDILRRRRSDAAKRMDLGVNRILEALGERHRQMVEDQTRIYEHHNARMQQFLDDYRKEDVARSHALQEELARDDKVERAGQEYAARMDAASSEHRAEIARLNSEIEKIHESARADVAGVEKRWQGLLEAEQANTKAANSRADEISNRLSTVTERTEQQFKDRLVAMDSERERAVKAADQAEKIGNRSSKMIAMMALVMALAALAIGILIGMMWRNMQGGAGFVMVPQLTMMADTFLHSTAADLGGWLAAIPLSTQTPA